MRGHPQDIYVPLPAEHERNLRLALLAPGEILGGAERQILALTEMLVSDGRTSPLLILFHDLELANRARQLRIPVRTLGARGLVDLSSIQRLRQTLSEERIDAISLHGYRATVYLALALRTKRIRVIKTEHGAVESTGERLAERLRPRFYRWLENAATRWLGAHVVYVSRELQGHCDSEHNGLERSVIYNGIAPLDRASTSRPPEFRADAINLVAVGRLDRVKGLDIAIRALANTTMPSRAQLFLVGSGPELSALTGLARELGLTARVSFLGFRDNAYDYVAHADALLMPSHHEGLPYTLLEALSLGTPVIASRVGGLAEVLTDRQTALLVEPGNPAALAAAVRTLKETPEVGVQLTRNGRALVAKGFTADEMARQYRSLFDSVGMGRRDD